MYLHVPLSIVCMYMYMFMYCTDRQEDPNEADRGRSLIIIIHFLSGLMKILSFHLSDGLGKDPTCRKVEVRPIGSRKVPKLKEQIIIRSFSTHT